MAAVLKYRSNKDEKYSIVTEMKTINGKFGEFYASERAEGKPDYTIGSVKPENKGPKKPDMVLKVKIPGAETAEFVAGLFTRIYPDGTKVWKGKDLKSNVQYLFALNDRSNSDKK